MDKGGIERSMSRLSRGLIEKGWEVSILTEKVSDESISFFDTRVNFLKFKAGLFNQNSNIIFTLLKNIILYFKIKRFIERSSPSVILGVKNIPLSIMLKIRSKANFRLIIREAVDPKFSSLTQRSLFSRFIINSIKKTLYPKADKIIAISKGVKESLVNNFDLNSNMIEVIYNPAADESILPLSKENINPNLITGNPLITSIGRLTKQKDHITLLKAFKLIYEKIDSSLYIIGEGPERLNLEKYIESNHLEDRVKLLGYQNNPWKFLAKSDIFVLPSIWEGFGNVIVEAMFLGVPVISSDCPSGPREILDGGNAGKLFKVGDHNELAIKIEEMINCKNLSSLIQIASKKSESFTVNKITDQYESLLI